MKPRSNSAIPSAYFGRTTGTILPSFIISECMYVASGQFPAFAA